MTQNPIALVILAAAVVPAASREADPLARHRWQSRVVVVSGPDRSDPRVGEQRRAIEAAGPGIRERDLVVVDALGTGREARAVRSRLGLPDDAFRAVLVGKDGGAKLVSADPIPTTTLFETIDAMPMRRQEMRSR